MRNKWRQIALVIGFLASVAVAQQTQQAEPQADPAQQAQPQVEQNQQAPQVADQPQARQQADTGQQQAPANQQADELGDIQLDSRDIDNTQRRMRELDRQANQTISQLRGNGSISPEQRMKEMVDQLSQKPDDRAGKREVLSQLYYLNDNNDRLARVQQSSEEKLQTLNMLGQGQYVQMTRFAEPRLAYQLKSQLRITARRIKALDHPDASAVGDFWLMTADMYEINHSGLPLQARQVQAAELMCNYVHRYRQTEAADGVSAALVQLKTARLNHLIATSPGIAEPNGDDEQKAMTKLLSGLHDQMPINWWITDLKDGQVQPTHWQTGPGVQITFQRIDYRPSDWQQNRGGVVKLWIMGKDYQPQRVLATDEQPQTGAAGDLTEWRGRRVYIWGYTDNQWKANDVITAELKATDAPETEPTAEPASESADESIVEPAAESTLPNPGDASVNPANENPVAPTDETQQPSVTE